MVVAFSSLLFMSAVWVGELFFVEGVLGRGDIAYGLMLSIWTVGMALGALMLSPRVAVGAVAAASAVVSGSIVVAGNMVYWFEKQGRCIANMASG